MRVLPSRPSRTLALLLVIAGLFTAAARAHHYRLESATSPTPFLRENRPETAIVPAGIATIGGGERVLVADARGGSLHMMDVATGAIVGKPLTSPRFPEATGTGPDWAGLAADSKGNFYLVGSNSGPTDQERVARGALVRFRLKSGETPAIDDASVACWDVSRSIDEALKGLKLDASAIEGRRVEGLAIREGGGRLQVVLGLRRPNDKIRALVADITAPPSSGETITFRSLFGFDAGRPEGAVEQLVAMEHVPEMGGTVVLTSAIGDDGLSRGNTIWLVPTGERRRANRYATLEPGSTAGGLSVLGVRSGGLGTTIQLLITYDRNPGATAAPGRFQKVTLLHPRN